MSIASFARWLQNRDWAGDFSGSATVYPTVLAIHLSCIAVFGGLILVTNLRLLGWALPGVTVSDMVQKLRVWKWVGFLIMVTCGGLLAGSEAVKYSINPYFWTKMTLLVLIAVHALVFRGVYRNAAPLERDQGMPGRAKLAAALSLILWISVVSCGRMIGYYEAPVTPIVNAGLQK